MMDLSDSRVARNATLNLAGLVVPLIVGVLTIPIIVERLGVERFGVLAFAWILLGYASLFDLGVGRAATKYIAEAIALGDTDLTRRLAWTSLALQLGLGVVGAALMIALAPSIARLLGSGGSLGGESADALVLIALAVPVTIAMATLRGIHEAAQRFDIVNLVSVPSNALTYVLPALGASAGLGLPAIIGLLALNRVVTAAGYALLAPRAVPEIWAAPRIDASTARSLLGFGGWVTVTSIIGPVIVYADRVLIAALLGAAALGYYTAPFDLLTRLWIVPTALVAALFPWWSGTGRTRPAAIAPLYERASGYLFLMMGPPVLVIIIFADDLLRVWLGPTFAAQGGLPMRVLACGMLANALAQLPFGLVQALGRPDLTAKLHAIELVPFLVIAIVLIARFGLLGAAAAWTIRAIVDLAALLIAARHVISRAGGEQPPQLVRRLVRGVALLGASAAGPLMLDGGTVARFAWGAAAITAFSALSLFVVLDDQDRLDLGTTLRRAATLRQ